MCIHMPLDPFAPLPLFYGICLQALGVIPDKAIFLSAPNDVLLDRTRHRKFDYLTNKVYHMPPVGVKALSPSLLPATLEGGRPDVDLLGR